MNLKFRLARNTEVKRVTQLLKDAAAWLKSEGINQWSYLLSGGEDDEIERAILKEETYVAEYEGKLLGTFTISPVQSEWDFDLWGQVEGDSLYLHRLAVHMEYRGLGMGKEMIRWIERQFAGQYTYLRLDCVANNRKLNQFYLDNEFLFVGSIDEFNKYEKRL